MDATRLFDAASTSARGPIDVYVASHSTEGDARVGGGLVWSADGAPRFRPAAVVHECVPFAGCHAGGANMMVRPVCADVVALRHTFRIVGTMIGGMSGAPPSLTSIYTAERVTSDGALRYGMLSMRRTREQPRPLHEPSGYRDRAQV